MEIKTEELHKEIDLIQACITRMADNSFKLKEWYIALISGVITVLLSQECEWYLVSVIWAVITGVFWGLDAFYLWMETLFRWKYNWVLKNRKGENRQYLYDLNPHNKDMWEQKDTKNKCYLNVVFSKPMILFYGTMILLDVFITTIVF